MVHLFIAPYHYNHAPVHGIFFAIVGIIQVGWAVAVWRTPQPHFMTSGAIFAGGLVVLWGMAEWFPIPYDHQHGADWSAYVTKFAEMGIFGLSLVGLTHMKDSSSGFKGWLRLIVFPLLLGGALYGVAIAQAQGGWLTGGAAPETTHHPTTGDGDHTHSATVSTDSHASTDGANHHHDSESAVAMATVAILNPTRPLATPNPSQPTPPYAPFTLQHAGIRTYQLTGTGETITENFGLEAGLVLFEFSHAANTPFAFFLLDQESNHLTMPANHLHGVAGMGVYRVREDGDYQLHAIAEDAWTIAVTPLDAALLTQGATPLEAMQGTDSTVSLPTRLEAGTYEWQWSHTGELAFEIMVLDVAGKERIVVLESTGVGEGTATFTVPESNLYLVYVFADGDWTVIP
jgi:hypothetical protein